ncbi:ATP-binding protein [Streptomyces triticirhizae]|uniref:ATP-binding protein n=2 Tax=Streptomyces triticirhizae TaxID=2483353 RepID=A0A3M2LPP2_9ACTN|nr:ATP-binding protein [Streptomyces triticirhizae]
MVRPVAAQHAYGWSLTASAQRIEYWRARVTEVLREGKASQRAVEVARLGVSELLSNVVKHAEARRCHLRVLRAGDDVVVQVCDRSPRLPVIRRPDWSAECGRGLWLLREMADDFGYMPVPYPSPEGLRMGKTVWFSCRTAFSEGAEA